MRTVASLLLLLPLALTADPAQEAAANPPLADFPIDHFATASSPADVRFLLDAPAGKHGFIRVSSGALAVQVTPLAGAGRPLPVAQGRLLAEGGWEIQIGQVPTTSYRIKVVR